jgi:hypothetical protein
MFSPCGISGVDYIQDKTIDLSLYNKPSLLFYPLHDFLIIIWVVVIKWTNEGSFFFNKVLTLFLQSFLLEYDND